MIPKSGCRFSEKIMLHHNKARRWLRRIAKRRIDAAAPRAETHDHRRPDAEGHTMAWFYLVIAGLMEIGWAIGLKYTEGFSRLAPSVWTLLCMLLSIVRPSR